MIPRHKYQLKSYAIATTVVFAAITICSCLILPNITHMLVLGGIWLLSLSVLSHCPWSSKTSLWVLAVAMCLLTAGFFANLHMFTVGAGGTLEHPVLENPDSYKAWNNALLFLDLPLDGNPHDSQIGYGFFISIFIWIFGRSVAVPMLVNVLCTLLTLIIVASTSVKVLHNALPSRSSKWIANAAIIIMASLCYFLQMGDLVLKEAPAILACAMIIRAMLGVYYTDFSIKYSLVKNSALLIAGALILAVVRNNYMLFMFIGAIALLPWTEITTNKNYTPAIKLLCIAATCYLIYEFVGNNIHPKSVIEIATSSEPYIFFITPNQEPWASLIGDYTIKAWYEKILWLPLCCAVQFLIPFPWHFTQHIAYGYTQIYAHIAYTWYALGGLLFYFIGYLAAHFKTMMRAPQTSLLARIFIFGIIFWVIPAYINAGMVSRYAICSYTTLIPAAVYVISQCRRKRSFVIFAIAYITIMALGLSACYLIHTGA